MRLKWHRIAANKAIILTTPLSTGSLVLSNALCVRRGWFDLGSWEWLSFLDTILGFVRMEMVIDLEQCLMGSWPLNGGVIGRNEPADASRLRVLWERWLFTDQPVFGAWLKRFRIQSGHTDTDKNYTENGYKYLATVEYGKIASKQLSVYLASLPVYQIED